MAESKPTILIDIGPLAIVPARDDEGRDRHGLYLIWVKEHGAKIGPYYSILSKAHDAARAILARYPAPVWQQPIGWLVRQKEMLDWIEEEIGLPEELIGGYWVDENGKIIVGAGLKRKS